VRETVPRLTLGHGLETVQFLHGLLFGLFRHANFFNLFLSDPQLSLFVFGGPTLCESLLNLLR